MNLPLPLKLVTLLLLLPVLCMGFLCGGALPLCECAHSCHGEAARAVYLPAADICGHDHGTECGEHHVDERLSLFGFESRVRPEGGLTVTPLPAPLPAPRRAEYGGLSVCASPAAARAPDVGRTTCLRC